MAIIFVIPCDLINYVKALHVLHLVIPSWLFLLLTLHEIMSETVLIKILHCAILQLEVINLGLTKLLLVLFIVVIIDLSANLIT
jgi:hypothetical protein